MNLISFLFIGFCLILTVFYYLSPGKLQNVCLLAANILFLLPLSNRIETLICLFLSILITYAAGLLLDVTEKKGKDGRRKAIFTGTILINLFLLCAFKYTPFIRNIASYWHAGSFIPDLSGAAPLGISFYTLQLLGYLIDVYNKRIYAEHHLFRFLLFGSYFPQMTSGPISRYEDLGHAFAVRRSFNYQQTAYGFQRMIWGFFKKLVISERAAVPVNTIFGNYGVYNGFYIVLAAVLYSIQLYTDFSGCMDIVIGISEVLGIPLADNFRSPYLSHSISEFWRRWHITLSFWLRDYIYIPLGGSRCSRLRKYFNLMVTFLVSGLWHGGAWNFIFWGFLHGIYQILGDLLKPVRRKLCTVLHMKPGSFGFRLGQILITFFLVSFAWIFFRARSLTDAFGMFRAMTTWNPAVFSFNGLLALGLDIYDIFVLVLSLILLGVVDVLEKRFDIRTLIEHQWVVFRWVIYLGLLFLVLIYGEYGTGFNAESFIYAQF